jgi:hypothetical protein
MHRPDRDDPRPLNVQHTLGRRSVAVPGPDGSVAMHGAPFMTAPQKEKKLPGGNRLRTSLRARSSMSTAESSSDVVG